MSKKLLAIVTVIVCVLMAFTACDGGKSPLTGDNGKNVSVGGFMAETDDYVYFINGSELYTEDNTLNKVEKGALARVKKTDLEKGSKATVECVVSKLVSTSYYSAGIAVANGRIYFATPSAEKDKIGTVKNTEIEFYSAKLDGTDLKKIATSNSSDGNSAAYKFQYVDEKMYVTFLTEETVTENGSDVTKKYLNVYGDDGKQVFKTEYESYVFDKNDGKYLYYTASVKNEALNSTESFNAVYRNEIGKDAAELMLYGAGSNRNTAETTYKNKGVQGVKFTLLAAQNGYLYLSVASVDTAPSTRTFYAYIGETLEADAEATYEKLTVMTDDGANASKALASTSIFFAPDNILYLDSTLGFCSYNYKNRLSYENNYGVTVEYSDSDLLSGSIAYVTDAYLYCQVSGVYYRINLTEGKIPADAKTEKISALTYSTSWYAPETVKVGDKEYVLGMPSSSDYKEYVFATEIKDFEADLLKETEDGKTEAAEADIQAFVTNFLTEEKTNKAFYKDNAETKLGAFLTGNNRTSVNYMWTKVVSLIGEDAQKEIDDYLEKTYPESDSSSSDDSTDSCSSAVTGSAIIAAAMMGGFVAIIAKKRGK